MRHENELKFETTSMPSVGLSTLGEEATNDNPITTDVTPFKRILDVVIAVVALVFLAPLILVFAILIKRNDGCSAIFTQSRVGRDGELFNCYKLRSMVPNAEDVIRDLFAKDPAARFEWQNTQKLKNDPRITPIGQFIRKTSIDELPQLINVIKGEMSIVGPRPIVQAEAEKYGSSFGAYCAVRPGLTGLWQVSGRSETTYAERVELDEQYAKNRSFWGDVKIILMTIPAVLLSRGAV